MVLAVGKRVVEMNVGLEQFQMINDSIEQLRFTQEAFRDAQIQLTERMNELNGSLQIVQNELPAKAAESVGRKVRRLQHGLVKWKHKSSHNKRLPWI